MRKSIVAFVSAIGVTLLMPVAAFAHVVVTPNQATPGEYVSFTISVPNERNVAVTSLKVAIPQGVTDLQPNVKGGWTIETAKTGDEVSTITWMGIIPAGQRADFGFKAQTPAAPGELDWKATQTYADGMVVKWDQKPSTNETDSDDATSGPYSVTTITNDAAASTANEKDSSTSNQTILALALSIAALALSVLALLWRRRK